MYKKILSITLAFAVILGCANITKAEENDLDSAVVNEHLTGYMEVPEIDITDELAKSRAILDYSESTCISDGVYVENTQMYGSAQYDFDWDCYSSNYIYNLLSSDEKEVWRGLEKSCNDVLRATNSNYARTPYVYSKNLLKEDVLKVAKLFKASNPQYFFIFSYVSGTQGNGSVVCFGIYEQFQSGASRTAAYNSINGVLNDWKKQIGTCTDDYSKVKKIHDLIIKKVNYHHDFVNEGMPVSKEQEYLTQSAYSVFCKDKTVCAGYATAFAWLCNAFNIDSYCIPGKVSAGGHMWNKVRINDCWFNMDCTWDDADGSNGREVYYNNFCRNEQNFSNHQANSEFSGYLAPCSLDTGSSYYEPGTIPYISSKTANPALSKIKNDNNYRISIECSTPGATIYYTVDGTTPSCATTRSEKYSGSFDVAENTIVKAIAVCDGSKNSDIVSIVVKEGVASGTNGLAMASDGNWYQYKNGQIDTSCNDLVLYAGNWWLVQSGKVRFDYNGVARNGQGDWYISGGKVDFNKNGLANVPANTSYYGDTATSYDGWYNFKNGKIVKSSGLVQNSQGWWYVDANGKVDFSMNTVAKHGSDWWVVQNGKINFAYNGIAGNQNGDWYCTKGKVQFGANGLYNTSTGWYFIKGGNVRKGVESVEHYGSSWWYVGIDGKIDFKKNTVAQNSVGWWVVRNGQVDFSYNGIADNTYGSWYCLKGQVQFGVNGLKNTSTGWYLIKGGNVRKGVESVEHYGSDWWYVGVDGKIDFSYNGIAKNSNGTWYCKNGKVDFTYTGTYYDNATQTYYNISNGRVV